MASWSGKIALAIGVITFGGMVPFLVVGQENAATNETIAEDSASHAEEKPKPVRTGIPQKDYIHDPNLPRELNGFDLSDYPFYKRVPNVKFNFSCDNRHDGFYASIPHKCQVYHHCLFGERFDFLCANYTAFDQATFICHFANRVDCANSELYFDRNDALYKAESTTTTTPAPPQIKIVYVERPAPRPKKQRPSKPPTYDYYDYYENEKPALESTSTQPDYYYDYYEDEKTTKPTTTTTTTTRRSVRKRLPRPRSKSRGPNHRRSGNKRPPQHPTNQPPLDSSNRPQRVRQQGQNNPRRRRPNKSQGGNQPGRRRRRKKKTTTTTTTTTTAQPEYYDDYEYYDYYYDDPASVTSTTKSPATSGRISLEERRRNLLKSRKSKLQQTPRSPPPVEATPSAAQEARVISTEADYEYNDQPNTRSQTRGRRGERQGSSKQTRNRRLRSQIPVQ